MPIYEYECAACDKDFEEIVHFSKSKEVVCPTCAGVVTQKLSVIAGHRYYGPPDGGFHKTNMKAP